MGLLTTLIIHNQGKKRGAKRERAIVEEAEAEANEVCATCGYLRHQHSNDERALCPSYKF
jgi:rubrerythrin